MAQTIEVHWTKTTEHKTIIALADDGEISHCEGDLRSDDYSIDAIIDPEGTAPSDDDLRDDLTDFLIEEFA